MLMIRSMITGVGSYLPRRVLIERRSRPASSTRAMNGSSSAPAFASVTSPPTARLTSDLAIGAARAALAAMPVSPPAKSISSSWRPRRPTRPFPATAATVQARLGIDCGAAFDLQAVCSGFVYGLTTADCFLKAGPGEARPRHRRRDVLAHPRLEGPLHLRAVRRRRGRHGRRGCARARARRMIAAFWLRASTPMAGFATSSMSMAVLRAPRRSATCAWRAAKCFAMPIGNIAT